MRIPWVPVGVRLRLRAPEPTGGEDGRITLRCLFRN